MNFITWIFNRNKLFISSSLDVLIYGFICFRNPLQLNSYYTLIFILFWLFSSYVSGRYGFYKKTDLKKMILKLLQSGLLLFFFAEIIFFSLYSFNDVFYNFYPILNSNLIEISIYSFLIQIIWTFISFSFKIKNPTYVKIIGNEDFKNYVREKIEFFNFNNFKFINSENQYEKTKYIFDHSDKLKVAKWFQDKLHIIPCEIIDNQFFVKKEIKLFGLFNSFIKRISDLFLSFFLILVTSPIILIASFLIFIEDGGPIFYTQIRSGLNRKKFKIIKLRTMNCNAENGMAIWSSEKDKRITKIGNFLRKSRIDEIPQLWNVIRNDMSLIGPRPERPELEVDIIKELPLFKLRYSKLPGLTGWAQVNYPYASSLKETENKLSFDLFYIKNASILLDLIIFLKTIKIVLNRRGAIPKKLFE